MRDFGALRRFWCRYSPWSQRRRNDDKNNFWEVESKAGSAGGSNRGSTGDPPWNFIVGLMQGKTAFWKVAFLLPSLFPRKYSDNNFAQLPLFHPAGGRAGIRENRRIIFCRREFLSFRRRLWKVQVTESMLLGLCCSKSLKQKRLAYQSSLIGIEMLASKSSAANQGWAPREATGKHVSKLAWIWGFWVAWNSWNRKKERKKKSRRIHARFQTKSALFCSRIHARIRSAKSKIYGGLPP